MTDFSIHQLADIVIVLAGVFFIGLPLVAWLVGFGLRVVVDVIEKTLEIFNLFGSETAEGAKPSDGSL